MDSREFVSTDHEFYPMPLFVQLAVSDLSRSTLWYRELGFDVVYEMPVMAHLRYRKYADVMLVVDDAAVGNSPGTPELRELPHAPDATHGRGVVVYLTVKATESVDDLAARATTSGIQAMGPHETEWNTRELAVTDPDGYEFVFSEVVDPERSFEDVVRPAGARPRPEDIR